MNRARTDIAVVALLTLAALALRIAGMRQSLLGDELFTYADLAGRGVSGVIDHVAGAGVEDNPPLYFVLAEVASHLGDPRVWLRLPSVLLGAATVPVLYAAGRLAVGERAALWGAALSALSPFALFYGTEGRAYATVAFFVALSTLAGLRRWWVLYAVAVCAALYSHYTAVFALAAQAVWLWVARPEARRPLVIATGAAALAFVLWLPSLAEQARDDSAAAIGAAYPLTLRFVGQALGRPVCCHPFVPVRELPGIAGVLLLAAGGVVVAAGNLRVRRERVAPEVALVGVLAAATPVGLLLYSVVGTDLLAPRNLSASIPALYLLLGWLIARLPGRLALAGGGLLAAGLLLGLVIGLGASKQRPDLRAAAELIDARAGARDLYAESLLSLSDAPELRAALRINFDRPHPRAAPLAFRREGGRLQAVTDRSVWLAVAGGRRLFVVAPRLPDVAGIPDRRPISRAGCGGRTPAASPASPRSRWPSTALASRRSPPACASPHRSGP